MRRLEHSREAPISRSDRLADPEGATLTTLVALGDAAQDDPADRWLVWLRWVAVLGMAATILVADAMVEGLEITSMMSVLLAIGGTNLVWLALLSKTVQRRAGDGRRYVELQLGVDVLLLATMLWFAGGIGNPFAPFLTLQIALAGLLCTPRATLAIATLTIVAVAALVVAPPLPPLSATLENIGVAAALCSLSALLGAFVAVYARRLSRLREESARNEKLAVLGRLVGSMSHELNTPLATILLLSRDLAQFRASMPDSEVDEVVRSIADEAARANDIVGLVRGHVGADQAMEPTELAAFVREHADAELDRLGFRGERRFHLPDTVMAPVIRRALVQILANLLRNACEASLLGRRQRITISVVEADGLVRLSIEDRGPGFSPAVLARLGEPFQTTKEASGGMGLGLYVSGLLARQMGARLAVESGVEGARVVLVLDASRGGTQAMQEAQGPSSRDSSGGPVSDRMAVGRQAV